MAELNNVETRVREIVAKYAKVEPSELDRDTELQSLNIQSLDLIEIIFEVEDTFNVDIEQDEKTANLSTLGDVLEWLTENIEAQSKV